MCPGRPATPATAITSNTSRDTHGPSNPTPYSSPGSHCCPNLTSPGTYLSATTSHRYPNNCTDSRTNRCTRTGFSSTTTPGRRFQLLPDQQPDRSSNHITRNKCLPDSANNQSNTRSWL